jgi:hypothetical protein
MTQQFISIALPIVLTELVLAFWTQSKRIADLRAALDRRR